MKKSQDVDATLDVLESDKRLPTFPEFFITCLLIENAECVNLKELFPKLHNDLSVWLANRQGTTFLICNGKNQAKISICTRATSGSGLAKLLAVRHFRIQWTG